MNTPGICRSFQPPSCHSDHRRTLQKAKRRIVALKVIAFALLAFVVWKL